MAARGGLARSAEVKGARGRRATEDTQQNALARADARAEVGAREPLVLRTSSQKGGRRRNSLCRIRGHRDVPLLVRPWSYRTYRRS